MKIGGFKNPQCGRIYDPEGLSPTLNTMQGGSREPKIITRTLKFVGYSRDKKGKVVKRHFMDTSNTIHTSIGNGGNTDCFVAEPTLGSGDYWIRKLTPRECFRLMGVSEENIDKIQRAGISNSQQYKMAGNSIVVDVIFHIFRKMFIDKKSEDNQLSLF